MSEHILLWPEIFIYILFLIWPFQFAEKKPKTTAKPTKPRNNKAITGIQTVTGYIWTCEWMLKPTRRVPGMYDMPPRFSPLSLPGPALCYRTLLRLQLPPRDVAVTAARNQTGPRQRRGMRQPAPAQPPGTGPSTHQRRRGRESIPSGMGVRADVTMADGQL